MSHSPATPVEAWLYQDRKILPQVEFLAEENPLDISLDGESLAITLCSPDHHRDLALGLLFSEGRIDSAGDIVTWREFTPSRDTTEISVARQEAFTRPGSGIIPAKAHAARKLAMNSACGLCGKTEWENPPAPWMPAAERPQGLTLKVEDIPRRFAAMSEGQEDFRRTGACHAAAAFSPDGELLSVREDIGRHNAVDKVVGDLLAQRLIGREARRDGSQWPALLCVSGRVAYEIVAKAYRAGFAAIASVGAPSSLSVRQAQTWGLTLVGFCREGRATLYSAGQTPLFENH